MKEFGGTVCHQIDDKGRVRIPSKFLSRLGEHETDTEVKLVLMAGSQGCISVYPPEALEIRLAALRAIPNTSAEVVKAKRKVLSSIEYTETDKQGRVVIPGLLRTNAQIVRELVTVGMDDHFEIWAKEVYDRNDGDMGFETAFGTVGYF